MNLNRKNILIVFAICLAIGCAIYGAGLNSAYYADDFKYVVNQPSTKTFHFFLHSNPNAANYRPIELMVLTVVQTWFGTATLPIHLLVLLCHILLTCLVYYASIELGFSKLQGLLAGAFMLVSQANALAVLSNDTLSQVAGTLFGFYSLWSFYRFQVANKLNSDATTTDPLYLYIASLLFFSVSLWMKETSLSFLLAVIILAFISAPRDKQFILHKKVLVVLPYVFITVIYILIRSLAVSAQADDRYTFSVGYNVIINLALTLYSAFLPISTVSLFSAFADGNTFFVVAITGMTITLMAIIILGVIRASTPSISMVLIILTFTNMFPMVVFKHVSELYAYNSMPAISMLFGIGLMTCAKQFIQRKLSKVAFVSLLVLLFASQVVSIQQKAHLMKENGQKASSLVRQIIPYVHSVPVNGTLILLNPANTRPEYSVFLMNDFNVLKYGTNIISSLSGRNDIHIWIVSEQERARLPIPSASLILSLLGNDVKPIQKIGSN
jgi:hypothetical protein